MALDYEAIATELIHPTQLGILRMLDGSTRSPRQMSERLGQPLGQTAYHVRELHKRDLIVLVSTEPRRGALEHFYTAMSRVRKQRRTRATNTTGAHDAERAA
jgi:hypothetical protein